MSGFDVLLRVHLVLVIAITAFLAWALVSHGNAPDANIGAGFAALFLVLLGLPWSLALPLVGVSVYTGELANDLLIAVPALVNTVVLYVLARTKRRASSTSEGERA